MKTIQSFKVAGIDYEERLDGNGTRSLWRAVTVPALFGNTRQWAMVKELKSGQSAWETAIKLERARGNGAVKRYSLFQEL